MPIKPRYKRRFLWSLISFIGVIVVSVFIVPPMITLNSLKPKIEQTIFKETGIPVKINGDIHFSLLGKATIVAHDISLENGFVSSCEFAVPLMSIFDIEKANISGDIYVNNASLSVEKIKPFSMSTKLIVKNSKIKFLNKTYDIVNADLSKESVYAIVRTNQHKYEIKSTNNKFVIKNKNNDLNLSGDLYKDGSAVAHISITAQNINRWFEFESPKITGKFPITADIKWNGSYGVNFTNISANGISGEADLQEDGYKIIKLKNDNADYDMSFILKDTSILKNADLNLDFNGNIKFLDKKFKHLFVNIVGEKDKVNIKEIIADDLIIKNGYIDEKGAHNLDIQLPENEIDTKCIFNGTPTNWYCSEFQYGKNTIGELYVNDQKFYIKVSSKDNLDDVNTLVSSARKIGQIGKIDFVFENMAGTLNITQKDFSVVYKFVKNKNLKWAKTDLYFLPEFMLEENGDFTWDDSMYFIPKSKDWHIQITKDSFILDGNNIKTWFENIDSSTIVDLPYVIYGNYKNKDISNLKVQILNQKFTGSASGNNVTLKTDILNLDSLLTKEFKNNYEQLSFFVNHPLFIPFDLPINISLSADSLIYKNDTYNNFVYSLKPKTQMFSVTDSDHGSILTTIKKDRINYDINIQLNKFVWKDYLLPQHMPLNISDTSITADIKLKTHGKIAHDITENIQGTFDASFENGTLHGINTDKFYASAKNINTFNVEDFLYESLKGGTSKIKKLHIKGTYDNGDIKTTEPFELYLKHTDILGTLDITKDKMFTKLKLVLRGTSSEPKPIEININQNNKREFSLSDMVLNFDPEYMRTFIQTHDKF